MRYAFFLGYEISRQEARESVTFVKSKVNDDNNYSTFYAKLDYDRKYKNVDWHDRVLTTDLKIYDLQWQNGKNDLNLTFEHRMDDNTKVIDITFNPSRKPKIKVWKDVKVTRKSGTAPKSGSKTGGQKNGSKTGTRK